MHITPLKHSPFSIPFLTVLLVVLSLFLKAGSIYYLQLRHASDPVNGRTGDLLSWPPTLPHARMAFEDGVRYQLDTPDGAAEWAALIPPSEGLVYLGRSASPYTISMIHQLRCYDIIRKDVTRDSTRDHALAKHCLNYLKQMVLCRGDLHLESFQHASNKDPIDMRGVFECKDWNALYDEIYQNQRTAERLGHSSSSQNL